MTMITKIFFILFNTLTTVHRVVIKKIKGLDNYDILFYNVEIQLLLLFFQFYILCYIHSGVCIGSG